MCLRELLVNHWAVCYQMGCDFEMQFNYEQNNFLYTDLVAWLLQTHI